MAQLPVVGVEAMISGLGKFQADSRLVNKSFSDMGREASGLGSIASSLTGQITGLVSSLAKIGTVGAGVAIAGIGAGLYTAVSAGLEMNNTMEQARGRINAFTKDAGKTEEILQDVRKEAAKTPFEFDEMASSVANLLPAAKQADVGVMDLLRDAEILAASNPAEGLEGAGIALREAVSGDFTSVIERFNLPRQMINQLKEEGVPNIEIVRRAMQEMGYDMDLVTALANTASGRWSTFKDTLTNVAATVTQPIFDAFSQGLGDINGWLAANEPMLTNLATLLAGQVAAAVTAVSTKVTELMTAFQSGGFTGLATALGIPPEVITTIQGVVTEVGRLFDVFKTGMEEGGLSGGLGAIFADLQTTAMTAINDLIAQVPTMLGNLMLAISGYLRDNWPTIQAALVEWSGKFFDWVSETAATIGEKLGPLLTGIGDWLVSPQAQEMFTNIGKTWAQYVIDSLLNAGSNIDSLTKVAGAIANGMAVAALAVVGTLVAVGSQIMAGIWSGMLEYIGIDLKPAAVSELGTILTQIGSDIKTIASHVGTKIVAAINDGLIATLQSGMKLGEKLREKLEEARDMVSEWQALGADFMAGLLEGITKNSGAVLEHIKSLVRNSLDQFGLGWAIQSPSRITHSYARDLILGAVEGAEEMGPKLNSTLSNIAQNAVEGMADAIEAATPSVADTMRDLAQSATTTLSGQWLVSSPSKVFFDIAAQAGMGIVTGAQSMAGQVGSAFSNLGQSAINSLMTGMTVQDTAFIDRLKDDLDMGGIAKAAGAGGGQWKNFRNIIHNAIEGNMHVLEAGDTGTIFQLINREAARFKFPPSMAQEFTKMQGLVQHLTGTFGTMFQKMRIENLSASTSLATQFVAIGKNFADMVNEQVSAFQKMKEEAGKTAEGLVKLKAEETKIQADTSKTNTELENQASKLTILQTELEQLTTTEGANQIAIDKKRLAIEKANESLAFGERQMEIYRQELAALQAQEEQDALKIEKKVLQMDRLAESMDAQEKQLVTLKEELAKLTAGQELDTVAIERKQLEIEKLIQAMDANKQSIIENQQALEANLAAIAANEQALADYRRELERKAFAGFNPFATDQEELESDLAMIEMLQEFLKGTGQELRIIGEELGGIFAGSGMTSDIIHTRLSAQEELNQLLAEQAAREQEILNLEKAQKQLDFLGNQLNLMKMLSDRGLNPADILGGMKLGIDASAQDLLAATNAVVQAMVDQINSDLQIHSPSGVMIDIAKQIMAGLPVGFSQMIPAVTGSLGDMMARLSQGMARVAAPLSAQLSTSVAGPISPMMAGVLGGSAGDTYHITNQFGGNTINTPTDEAAFAAKVIQIIRRELS